MDEDNQPIPGVTPEGGDAPQEDYATSEHQEETPDASETSQSVEGDTGKDQDQEGTEVTDRGTKVAKEPESRYYQQIKNENADMRRLLGDPKLLKEYMREVEGTQAPKEGQEDELAKIVEAATLPNGSVDALKLTQMLDERTAKKIEQGMTYLSKNMSQAQQMHRRYDEEKAVVRSEHPELDPRNKEQFDPELEQFIAERYIAQGGLEGKASLKEVVDTTFTYLSKQRKAASTQAETEIVRKRAGAIPTPGVSGQPKDDESRMSPDELLAKRVQAALSRR